MTRPNERTLALVPAKGGSTRLPGKNILPLCGRPLIAWTIQAASQCQLFDRIVVSTEDDEVAAAATASGADVPFIRPHKLAVDPAGVVQVALHALELLEAAGDLYEKICILLPTCPLRTAADICAADDLYKRHSAVNVMSVGPFSHTPFNALLLNDDGLLSPHFPSHFGKKSQEQPVAYRPNGAIHILDVSWFKENQSYNTDPVHAYVMPANRSIDIDNAIDFTIAEALLNKKADAEL